MSFGFKQKDMLKNGDPPPNLKDLYQLLDSAEWISMVY